MGDHASAVSCTLLQQDRRGRLIPRADIPSGTKAMTSDRRIAGIGASAGGVEALEAFFKAVPQDNGIAFVVVTHLDPNRESMLAGILGRATQMPVVNARDGEPVEAQHVYVLPPGAILTIREGRLRLRPTSSVDRERTPIDLFFSSLAEDQGEHAIGIAAYAHRIGQFQKKGAPMGWIKDDVLVTTPQAIGVSGYGKSPNAAKLIVDFTLSQEGQTILRRSGRIPANPKVDPDPPELVRGRRLFYSDIIDGGTRYNEVNDEFLKVFTAR